MALQRSFSGFPAGYPGVALLLLRLVVGGSASFQAWLLIAAEHTRFSTGAIVGAVIGLLTGLALIIGFMTPIASVLLSAGGLSLVVGSSLSGHLPLFQPVLARLEFVVISIALISLGPGALSLDARLYGRREIQINGNGP
jgi:uncharacterized membrane protein YphA (DoxX/SURF4 family)